MGADAIHSHTEYDAFGRITQQTDANGNVTDTLYTDSSGTTLTKYKTAHNGPALDDQVTEITTVDVFGRTLSITDAAGVTTQFAYDATEREQLSQDMLGNGTKVTYNAQGQILQLAKGEVNTAGDDLVSALELTTYTYDKNGNQVTQTDGSGDHAIVTTYTFDDNNRRLSEIQALGSDEEAVVDYAYDNQGNLIRRTDALGTTLYAYNGQGQLSYQIDAANSLTAFSYDAAGRQTAVSRYTAAVTQLPTDKSRYVLSEATVLGWGLDADSQAVTDYSVYDAGGRLTFRIDATGGVTQHIYNARGLVIEQIRYTHAIAVASDTLKQGNLTQTQLQALVPSAAPDTDQVSATVYDNNGQARFSLQKRNDGQAQVNESRYDAAGRLIHTLAYAQTIAYQGDMTVDALTLDNPDSPLAA